MNEARSSIGLNLTMLIARIVIVFGLLPNGLRKLASFHQTALGMGGDPQMINGRLFPMAEIDPLIDFPLPHFFLACSVTFDILGALLVIFGWRAREAAGVLTVYCLMAMTIYHWDFSIPENLHSAIRTAPMFGGLMYIAAVGAGGWSLDAWLQRRRGLAPASALTSASRA